MLNIICKPVSWLALATWAAILIATGCNSTETTYSLVEVQGVVTFDQAPLSDAKIVFLPQRLKSEIDQFIPLAYGTTNEKGEFSLADQEGNSQLLTGEYSVIISKARSENQSDTSNQQLGSFLPAELADLPIFNRDDELIPRWYNRDTELVYRIGDSAKIDRPKFELKSKRGGGRP